MNPESSINKAQSVAPVEALPADPEQEHRLRPSIWVASLTDHEYEIHHGAWISADQPLVGIRAELDDMLAHSPMAAQTGKPSHDWGIFYHRDFGGYELAAFEGLERISRLGRGLVKHGPPFAAWAAIADEERLDNFDAAFLGHFDTLHSYIEQRINDLGYDRLLDEVVTPSIRPYVKIDITATANDLLLGGDLQTAPAPMGGVWVFDARC